MIMSGRLFAIGDIHGCFEPLKALIEEKIRIRKTDKVVFLGDYIDRGPQGKEVIDYIMRLPDKGYDVIPLSGNHEAMLLDAYADQGNLPLWIYNGGYTTLMSFHIRSIRELSDKYLEFFRGLKYWHQTRKYIFVHAGFNDELEDPFTDKYAMIWECRHHYENPVLKDKVVVHGHRAVPAEICKMSLKESFPVIDVDTGCVYRNFEGFGRLTAVELYSKRCFIVGAADA